LDRTLCFENALVLFVKPVDRVTSCWISSKTKPAPSSTADNARKKKVNASKFRSFKKKPAINAIAYNVIQSNSAVISKYKLEWVLTSNVKNNIKKKKIKVFKLPKNIGFYTF